MLFDVEKGNNLMLTRLIPVATLSTDTARCMLTRRFWEALSHVTDALVYEMN